MSRLIDSGIRKNAHNESVKVFESVISRDFLTIPDMSPSEYVNHCWSKFEGYAAEQLARASARNTATNINGLRGTIFELIITTEFYRRSICPLYLQASVAFVPNARFDALLYTSLRAPIGLSMKVSLRERYKQADLEAVALKYVHRRALNYLITLAHDEVGAIRRKAQTEEVLLGINKLVLANTEEFDVLVEELSRNSYIEPGAVEIISAGTVVRK
ncbi:MAG: hypothetical protein FWE48_05850 [Coriobacteriia bacterium]|nr:hypothetical protein [Coriobacteriia bacterium]